MEKKQKVRFRDGYIQFLEEEIELSDFNAKKNGKTYKAVKKQPFNELTKRVQDKEYISQISDKQLDMKVETPNSGLDFNKKYYVIINDNPTEIFDITYHDDTKEKYFLYLTSIGVKKDVIIKRD